MRVLVVNAGSSSLKHALVDSDARDPGAAVLSSGEERWESGESAAGRLDSQGLPPAGPHGAALRRALAEAAHGAGEVDAIGHRVVHGGGRFEAPALIDADVREGIAQAAKLAPLHNRAALEGIDAASAAFARLPQVACFDTAFHRTIDPAAATYAIPGEWAREHGIRRFGFHGLNVSWCAQRARELLGEAGARRLIVCHLGSGCSVSAVRDGRSADTSMGFTPLDGVPMATRSGALDPGVVLYLLRSGGLDADAIDDGLNHRAGLLGVSGISADLREVLAAAGGATARGPGVGDAGASGPGAASDDADRAQLAIDVFVRGIAGSVAAMATTLRGLDALVFTAGIGEHSPPLRAAVAERLAHLGVALDDARNDPPGDAAADRELSPEGARIRVLTLRAREEYVIARETATVVGGARG